LTWLIDRQNDRLTKWLADKMIGWRNGELTLKTCRQNDWLTKCLGAVEKKKTFGNFFESSRFFEIGSVLVGSNWFCRSVKGGGDIAIIKSVSKNLLQVFRWRMLMPPPLVGKKYHHSFWCYILVNLYIMVVWIRLRVCGGRERGGSGRALHEKCCFS